METNYENANVGAAPGHYGQGFAMGLGVGLTPTHTANLIHTGEMRRDIFEGVSDLKESILQKTIGDNEQFRNVDNNIYEARTEALKSQYENRLETKEALFELHKKIDREGDQIKRLINEGRVETEKLFALERERNLIRDNQDLRDRLKDNTTNGLLQKIVDLIAGATP